MCVGIEIAGPSGRKKHYSTCEINEGECLAEDEVSFLQKTMQKFFSYLLDGSLEEDFILADDNVEETLNHYRNSVTFIQKHSNEFQLTVDVEREWQASNDNNFALKV